MVKEAIAESGGAAVSAGAGLRRGDSVRVKWEADGDVYDGPGKFVQHLKAGQRGGVWDWYIANEPQCLVRLPDGGGECCFPTRCVTAG